MLTKMRIGAAFALTAAAIIGCGSDKKTTVAGGTNTELNSNEFGAASSISQNNLAQDKGGFSENNQNWVVSQCRFNVKQPTSDSNNSSADGSAMIVFATADNATGFQRIYASHFNGSDFTPPQELTGADREESVLPTNPAGPNLGTHVNSIILVPLNTSSYSSSTGTTAGGSDQLVRANAGNWLILWDAQTHTVHPNAITLDTSSGAAGNGQQGRIASADVNGTHHTVYATMFIKNLRSQAIASTQLIGNTSTSGTANGPATTVKNGFQVTGTEITTLRGGASLLMPGGAPGNGFDYRPSEDIGSYGVATDTWAGCASFGTNAANPGGITTLGKIGTVGGGGTVPGPSRVTAAGVPADATAGGVPSAGLATFPAAAAYAVGDNTSFIQLFWMQLVTSHGSGSNSISIGPSSNSTSTSQLGPNWRLFTANFDLASMSVKNQATVAFPTNRNGTVGNPTGLDAGSVAPAGNMVVYNNIVFFNYFDASMQRAAAAGNGVVEANIDVDAGQNLGVVRVIPATNGGGAIDPATFDVTRNASNKHPIVNSDNAGVGFGRIIRDVETVTLTACPNPCNSLYGADEGMGDLTAFVLVTNSSNLTNNESDINTQVGAFAMNPTTGAVTGPGSGAAVGTGNIRRISNTPLVDNLQPQVGTAGVTLHDDCFDAKTQVARDGSYIIVGWRQATGSSTNATLDLYATVYKTFRTTAAVSSTGGGTVAATPTTLDQRVAATPVRVSTGTTVGYTLGTSGPSDMLRGAPVAAWAFQGNLGYRCGFQSDMKKMTLLYAYADGTEDRLFARSVNVDLGTTATAAPANLTANSEAEFETGDAAYLVPDIIRYTDGGTPATTSKTTGIVNYKFLVGSFGATNPTATTVTVTNGTTTLFGLSAFANRICSNLNFLQSTDAGGSGSTATSTAGAIVGAGDVLVVFAKNTDNTISDGNFFDRKVIAARYTGGSTIADRAVISRNVHENATNAGALRTNLSQIVPRSTKATITTAALAPDNGTYIYFTAPQGDNNSSPTSVWSRHFKVQASNTSATPFTGLFFPTVGANAATNAFSTGGSSSTGLSTDALFKDPIRLDRNLRGNAAFLQTVTKGKQVIVFIRQDNHIWASTTQNGDEYTNQSGLPTPQLVDNNTSSSNSGVAPGGATNVALITCRKIDSNCDSTSGTILVILKDDVQANLRAYVRVLQ